ncbi:hypothetical protein ACG97_16690 [Vogesella sp. EB]|uniref:Uncharacterized protein n=1 Tax=Vogesella indigofera TaxID=45465 RepID=A0A495BKJ2_VOGIN|nr:MULTISPECIES: hypothetical protein [Vogesella]KMJ47981.1 hypothetical protein ACG97_16690 [Vogesella sp. EB]RKQ61913.1 hypothetical protein C8E02_0483 [Vogesella indigofera]
MATPNPSAQATTNTREGSVCTLQAGCDTMWSLAQQFAYRRLSTREQGVSFPPKRSTLSDYAQRARTIAATYARLYLEQEEYGNPKKKGRYYWMALGAFASKTVACTLDLTRVDAGKHAPDATGLGYVRDGLGKGNFWLFQDIAPTHWYHNYSPDTFAQCLDTRGENGCHQAVIDNLKRLPWADTALPTLKYLPISGFIKSAFATIKKIEAAETPADRAKVQLSHLMDIARHEQGVILQPLMYDDPEFAKWVQRQRGWMSWFSPDLELVFTHACQTDNPELKSAAPEGTVLENYDSRMIWITSAANDFHRLMQTQTSTMETELKIMAGWYVSKD